jgi:hypothetical protein
LVLQENINCKFTRLDGYLVPHTTGESPMPTSATSALSKELDAAIRCHCLAAWGQKFCEHGRVLQPGVKYAPQLNLLLLFS